MMEVDVKLANRDDMTKKSMLILIWLLLTVSTVTAQSILTYGSAVLGVIDSQNAILLYTFQGAEGDQVTIQALAITPDLNLNITLQSGAQIIATSDNDPYTAGTQDARIEARLPANNTYLVLLSAVPGQTGDFLLKLSGQTQASKTVVTGSPADVSVISGGTGYYSFTADPTSTTLINLATNTPNFDFIAVLRNGAGQVVEVGFGPSAMLSVPAGTDTYEISISSPDSLAEGFVTLTLALSDPSTTQLPPAPVATEEVGAPPPNQVIDPNGPCVIFTTGVINVRSGPSTDDTVLTQIQAGQNYAVTGVYTNWYQIEVPGVGSGWVRNDVVQQGGNCANIPIAAPPINNQPPPTITPMPTTSNNNNTAPTATYTYTPTSTSETNNPTATATMTPSATPTTAAQIAPEDARFNTPLTIPLDNTASVLDFVSYPNGDREDRVNWDITGMNQNVSITGGQARLVITVSCFGEGTEHLQFVTGGNTYTCGNTIFDKVVTANSKTGSVVITAVGGDATYVQWVLTGTATRTN